MDKFEREQKIEMLHMVTGYARIMFEKMDDERIQREYIKVLGERE